MDKKDFFSEITPPELDAKVASSVFDELAQRRLQKRRESLQLLWKSFVGLSLATSALAWFYRLNRSSRAVIDKEETLLSFVNIDMSVLEGAIFLSETELDSLSENDRDELLNDFDLLVEMSDEDWQAEIEKSSKEES